MTAVLIKHNFITVDDAINNLEETQINILKILKRVNCDIRRKVKKSEKYAIKNN